MVYDRKQDDQYVAAPGGSPIDLRLELGRVFVPVGAPRACAILDTARAGIMRAWVDALIPRQGDRPSAAEVEAVEYIDANVLQAPRLRALLLNGIDTVERFAVERYGRSFAACDAPARVEALRAIEQAGWRGADCFAMVQVLTYEAYYAHPGPLAVLQRDTGWNARAAVTGSAMQPFDQELLTRVRTLPPLYRTTPTTSSEGETAHG